LRVSILKILLWANVAVTPEDNKIIVFHNGIPNGFIGVIPKGGHVQPIHIEGEIDM
jgi:hypothetical protein